jgi:hypothetical protein
MTTRARRIRHRAPLALLAGAALVLAACGGDDSDAADTTAAPAATTAAPDATTAAPGTTAAASGGGTAADLYTTPLQGVCPDNIVFQTNWWPEVDHALAYQLIGPDGKIDTSNNTYSGPLGSTGVNLEIRAGGPAIGYQNVTSLFYQDDSIYLGLMGTDEQVANSAEQPSTSILAWYQQSPQIFLWGNPDWDFKSVKEIGESGETVLAFESGTYLDVFTGEGLLTPEQIDTSYQGGPARFVAADGNIVQQGFITAEPYALEHETPEWNKPVKFLLVSPEYPVYQNSIAVRSDKVAEETPCLKLLVPLLQQAAVDYEANPGPVNDLLVKYVSQIDGGGFTLSAGGVADAVQKQIEYKIVANGPDGVFGSFDDARVQTIIDTLTPALVKEGKTPKDGLAPSDLYTNEFLDPSIKL